MGEFAYGIEMRRNKGATINIRYRRGYQLGFNLALYGIWQNLQPFVEGGFVLRGTQCLKALAVENLMWW